MYGLYRYIFTGSYKMDNHAHLRKLKRYAIKLPVEFYMPVKGTRRKIKIRAVTKDITTQGFSFMASYVFQKPRLVEFVFTLPSVTKPEKNVIYKLKGQVVWNRQWVHTVIYKTGICLLKGKNRTVIENIVQHLRILRRKYKK